MFLNSGNIRPKPSFIQSLICVLGVICFVFFGLFALKTSLHSIILLNIFWVVLHACYIDNNTPRLKQSMIFAIRQSASVLVFFILIGAVIAAFTISGAIPTLIYYGLDFISPQNFLPIGMFLCSMMSLAIGSCWGTIGTMGVALIGVASILHVPPPMAAGMIVSGAYFGDKFSPISDTTILSALSTETNLYKHIKGMAYSIIPAYILSLALFWFIGRYYVCENKVYIESLTTIQHLICSRFHVGFITLIPMVVMFILSMKKKPAELSMLVSMLIALLIAIFIQKTPLVDSVHSLLTGPNMQATGSPILDAALGRGGIQSMLWSMTLALLVLTLGGLLDAYDFITTLFMRMINNIKTPLGIVFSTLSTSIICNVLMGEAYLSIILSSRIFKDTYKKMSLDSCVLSKTIEEGSTFSTPLIPWTTSGVFIGTTLGVYPFDYMFWSLFNWVAPIVFLVFVSVNFAGVKMYIREKGMDYVA